MENKGFIYAVLSVLMWSTVATAFKLSLKYTDYIHLLLTSVSVSFLIFLFLVVSKKGIKRLAIRKQSLFLYMLLGLINPFLYYLVLFKAYSLLPAQIAQILNYTWPIMLVLFSSLILGEKIGRGGAIGILLGFMGVVTILIGENPFYRETINYFGIMLALLSAVIWAFFWIINVKTNNISSVKFFYIFLFGFLYIILYAISKGVNMFNISNKGIFFSSYVGIFEMGITFFVWEKALKYGRNTPLISNMIYLVPFISLFFIRIFLKERIMLKSVIGLALIIIGVLLTRKSSH